jgi:dipeptidyl aminopeptidase/acylaminoacyl peptidase
VKSLSLFVFLCSASTAAFAGPLETPITKITDPKSISSIEKPDATPVALEDLGVVRNSYGAVMSTSGKSVIVQTNLTGRYNLWRIDLGGNFPVQLTRSEDFQFPQAVTRDGLMLFAEDDNGLENDDLYAVPLEGGPVSNLSATPDYSERRIRVSPDDKKIAMARRPITDTRYDIVIMDRATRAVEAVTNEQDPAKLWLPVAWFPDNKWLLATRQSSAAVESSIYLIDTLSGKTRALSPQKDGVVWSASDLSPDGKLVAITSNDGQSQTRAGIMEVASGKTKWLKPTPWEQSSGTFSPDGQHMVFETSIDGRVEIGLVNVATMEQRVLPLPPGLNTQGSTLRPWDAQGRLLVKSSAANAPEDYWLVDPVSGAREQVTRQAIANLDGEKLPRSQIVAYQSSDGTPISAIVTIPWNLKRDGSNPAVVMPHGGPTYQSPDEFDLDATALASRGYLVIRPNFRGSTGYGKAFEQANRFDLGGGDLEDVVGAAKFLVETGYVHPRKIGITGGSYGGFLTLMAIGKKPDVFAAAVNQYGIMNWFTMWDASTGGLREAQRYLVGDPEKDKAAYERMSPFNYFENVRAPLLNLQGENDVRVPRTQADEADATIKKSGGVVETIVYPKEGHGFLKVENQMDARRRMVEWFDRHLKK